MVLTMNSRAGCERACEPRPRLNQTPCSSARCYFLPTNATYSPPGSVRLVVLELSRQEDSDQDLENTPLHRNHGNDTNDGGSGAPSLEIPEQLEECDHTDNSREVGEGSHGRTKLVGVRVELGMVSGLIL